jgi:hypothetical protein
MGFQEKNGTTTVFAKLTDLGKKYLLTEPSRFKIEKFSPFDDEIDYNMWNETNPNGTAYYGYSIEQMPLLEPVTSAIYQAKYNLIRDLPIGTLRMPTFTVTPSTVTLNEMSDTATILVQLEQYDEPQVKVILLDNTIADISAPGSTMIDVNPLAVQNFVGQSGYSYAKAFICPTNAQILVEPKINTGPFTKETKIIIIGTQLNARYEVPVSVAKNNQVTVATDS